MSLEPLPDSQAFYEFLGTRLSHGGLERSPEELVEEWRSWQGEFGTSVEGLSAAIRNMESGDQGKPLREVADEIYKKHDFTSSNDP